MKRAILVRHSPKPMRKAPMQITLVSTLALTLTLLGACAANTPAAKISEVTTKPMQEAMTSDQALQQLRAGNERFARGASLTRDFPAQVKATAEAQYPFAVVLSCLDSRIPVEHVFDQGIGDVFTARVAGNFANPDILGSLEFATKVVGAKTIVVLGHDKCGAVKGSCDNVQLGHISSIVENIKPSVEAVAGPSCSSKDAALVDKIAENNVDRTIKEIRQKSSILRELEEQGKLKIVGAMYDLDTGVVSFR